MEKVNGTQSVFEKNQNTFGTEQNAELISDQFSLPPLATESFATATDSLHNDTDTDSDGTASFFEDTVDNNDQGFFSSGTDQRSILPPHLSSDTQIISSKNLESDNQNMASANTYEKPTEAESIPVPTKIETTEAANKDEAQFDVAQHVYAHVKGVWAWGKSVPVVQNFLGIAEGVASAVLDKTIHMDLPAIDEHVAQPQIKKLDDAIVTPVILAVWNIIGPAVAKSDETIKFVVPQVLGPLGIMKDSDEKKQKQIEFELKEQNPEYTSAPLVN